MMFHRPNGSGDGWLDIRDTNTEGVHSYIVAEACGGVMEDPDIHYENRQVIFADNRFEARQKYDRLNNCTYYHGVVLEQLT